jgi:uncharacterized membrane protein YGL010W
MAVSFILSATLRFLNTVIDMRTLQNWLAEYSASHQNLVSKRIHWVCAPLITVCIIGILWSLSPIAALIYLILTMAFYASLSRILFLIMSVFSAFAVILIWILSDPLLTLSPFAPLLFYIGLFVLGWIGQLYVHKIEGKKITFFKDLQFVLIGPAWCAVTLADKFGISV